LVEYYREGGVIVARNCRICGDALETFYYRIDDRSDSFYSCDHCGAINPLKRNAVKPLPRHTNEWTASGTVTEEEAPVRSSTGGYHTGSKQKIEMIEVTEAEAFSI